MKHNIKLLVESFFDDKQEEETAININVPKIVDLGLPSGTLWSKYNLGTYSETEPGDYYLWASITPMSLGKYNSKYQYAPYYIVEEDTYSKYNEIDGYTHYLEEDDAAYLDSMRMFKTPTAKDIKELYTYTDTAWVTNFKLSGINGILFKSKKNNNYIFIPAAGYCYNGIIKLANSFFGVWSSEPSVVNEQFAYILQASDSILNIDLGIVSRNIGLPIRGIINK